MRIINEHIFGIIKDAFGHDICLGDYHDGFYDDHPISKFIIPFNDVWEELRNSIYGATCNNMKN